MKTYILYITLILFSSVQFAQQINYGSMLVHNEDESFIKNKIYLLIKSLNERDGKYLSAILTSDVISENKIAVSDFEQESLILTIKAVNIIIKDYSAIAIIKIEKHNSNSESEVIDDTLKLIKNDNHWKFDNLSKLTSLTNNALNNIGSTKELTVGQFTLVTPYLSDRTLIPKHQFTSPNTFEINANVTLNQLQRQLYKYGSEIDAATYTNSVNPDNTGNTCLFTLDSKWKRIIYSQRGSNDLKSFGETSNRPLFIRPTAIDVNEFGEVFVVDNDTKKIHKLNYNYSNNTLSINSILNIQAGLLKSPFDIDYSSNGTAFNRNDDFILITDVKRKSILKFSTDGILLNEFKTYTFEGVTYDICYPSRVTTTLDMVQFIDEAKNAVICGEMGQNNIYCYWSQPSRLPSNYRPTDIGIDRSYNIVVSDGTGMVHKFDLFGYYLCSYKNPVTSFLDTRRISNSTFSYPGYALLDISVNDRWSYSKGSKRLLPGADAIKLNVIDKGSYCEASCILTDVCYYKFEIVKASNNVVVKTYTNETWIGGVNDFMIINNNEVSCGSYKFRVSVKPYSDDIYGSYAVGWKSREILFSPLAAPVISNITQNPSPVGPNSNTRFTCNLSQGEGSLTYTFSKSNFPSDWSLTTYGANINYCTVHVGTIPTNKFLGNSIAVICTVKNSCDVFSTRATNINFSQNGCPTLAFEQNGNLVDENTLLVTSISNPDKDVTDYYLINTPLTPVDNRINLTIHEPQTEHTWFDNVSLLETRASPGETIVVNDEGQVINYKGVLPARILLNGETDITQNLLALDSLAVELNPGDKLTISRNAVEGDGDVVLGGEEPIIVKDRPSLIMNILTESKVEDNEEIKTESIPITNFFFRPNRSIISKRLRNLPTGTIEITVNKKLTLDYFVFVSDLRTARTRELPLVSAVHSVNGDIKSKLMGIDQNYSEMYPTERIDLSFSTTINSGNRAYILKTVGRYETDTTFVAKQNNLAKLNEQPIIPTENKLYDNYPNPFNPSTIIKYSLKDEGRVSLKIFNSLGEEVRTLVNEIKSAGNYEIEFNASELSSGVYIYQLTTAGFTQARKMILAK